MTMFPSASLWFFTDLPLSVLNRIKQTGFHYVDLELEALAGPGFPDALRSEGLQVSCVALDHHLPAGCSLEGNNPAALARAVDYLKKGFAQCQSVGAKAAYVLPCRSAGNLKNFRAALKDLAEEAASRGIQFCVEHVPGRALSSAKGTLDFIAGTQYTNLHLLLDSGHALITKERMQDLIPMAGNRLGYVQLDDNDGKSDKHWPLLDGCMRYEDLQEILQALTMIGYGGTLGLEVSNDRASVIGGLSRNRNLLLRLQADGIPKSIQEPETRRKK